MSKLTRKNVCGSNFSYHHHRFETFLEDMETLDLRTIELWGVAPHFHIPTITDKEVAAVAQQMKQRGLSVLCLTPEQVLYPVNIASGDSALRAASVNLFKRAAQICAQMETPYLFLTPGRGYEDEPAEEGWQRSAESLSIIGEYAFTLGVPCLFESLQRFETNLVKSLADMQKMVASIDAGNYQFVLDTCAMAAAGDTVEDYFKAFPGKIAHVHLVDGTPAGHMAWGDGNLPLAEYVEELERLDYREHLTFEIFGSGDYALNPRPALERCLEKFDARSN
ncbi:sugar phosphate isomerase/epimerase family protein [Mesorhizobium sp. GR13]|uniref:sugar phosphate isomerase/epimerase family protein n=1 Tax=Mesorhizobium sp. GR13 TaxID=2562308 RepID=UPI001FEE71F2|nr:sugar phosphate isomerase/epimerase family protein [Mesorhizobium sp. GR13]